MDLSGLAPGIVEFVRVKNRCRVNPLSVAFTLEGVLLQQPLNFPRVSAVPARQRTSQSVHLP
jgi:hypothetical protein